jgi:hypothetical protein
MMVCHSFSSSSSLRQFSIQIRLLDLSCACPCFSSAGFRTKCIELISVMVRNVKIILVLSSSLYRVWQMKRMFFK